MASTYTDPTKGTIVIEKDKCGKRRLAYKFPIKVNPKSIDKDKERVLKVHDAVIASLSPKQRAKITGRELGDLVKRALLLSSSELKELIAKGLTTHDTESVTDAFGTREIIGKFIRTPSFAHGKSERHLQTSIKSSENLCRYFTLHEVAAKELTKDGILSYMEWRERNRHAKDMISGKVSRSTIVKEVSILCQALKWARDELNLDCRLFEAKDFKMKANANNTKVVESLTVLEQRTLLHTLRQSNEEALHDAVLLYLTTGIRYSEIYCFKSKNLNFSDLYYQLHSISVNGVRSGGKTANAVRHVEITPTLRTLLNRGHIYRISEKYNPDYLRTRLRVLYTKGVLPFKVNIHQFRHTFCTNHLCAGESVFDVSHKMGHGSIQLTADRYAKQGGERMVDKNKTEMTSHLHWLEHDYFESPSESRLAGT